MKIRLAAAAFFLILLSLGCTLIGPELDLSQDTDIRILLNLRLSRIVLAFSCGAILAISGLCFQTLLNNPLASPYTLGIAAGASLGAALVIKFNLLFTLFGFPTTFLGAFCGALASIVFIFSLARVMRSDRMYVLLLAGIAFNYFAVSMTMFLQYMGSLSQTFQILRWTMGSLDAVDFTPFIRLLPFFILLTALIFYFYRELDLILFGEETALSRGVDVSRVQRIFFLVLSVSMGAVIAVCGPIGFVGLMVPHMLRLIVGNSHLPLAFMCIFGGGFFLSLCDTLGRVMIPGCQVPVGIITSLLGGPFFIYLLFRKK